VDSGGQVKIEGFDGTLNVFQRRLGLDGTLSSITLDGSLLSFNGRETLKGQSSFSSLLVDNLTMKKFSMDNAGGSIRIGNTNAALSGDQVLLENVQGRFLFTTGLAIDGITSRIEIPGSGIVAG
jgi:hypothetical protein